MKTCKSCWGTGGVFENSVCNVCKGSGVKPEQKPFDIGEHKFSPESHIKSAVGPDDDGYVCIDFDMSLIFTYLNKSDAIAIAKALGVTGDDL